MIKKSEKKYTHKFKLEILELYNNGKPATDILREFDLSSSTFFRWVSEYEKSNSFRTTDNLLPE